MHKNLDKWAAQRKTGIKPPGHSRISQDTSLHTAINNQQQTGWHRVIGARNGMLLARPFIFPPSKYFWKLSIQPPTEVIENTVLPNAGNDCYDMATLTSGSDFRHGDSYYAY